MSQNNKKEIPFEPKTTEDRVLILEYNDERREKHYEELSKDVKSLMTFTTDIRQAVMGTESNKDMGITHEIKQLKTEIKEIKTLLESHKTKITQFTVYFALLGFISSALTLAIITMIIKIFSKT